MDNLVSIHVVVLVLSALGIVLLILALAGQIESRWVSISLKGWPRIVAGVVGAILIIPAVVVSLRDRPPGYGQEVVQGTQPGCVVPMQPVSRGEPVKLGPNEWIVLGGTTISTTPRKGRFFVIEGGQLKPTPNEYYMDGEEVTFEASGRTYRLKAGKIEDAWASVQIVTDGVGCRASN